jgi:hypothetical protein
MRIDLYTAARRVSLSDPDGTSSLVGGNEEQDLDIQFLTYSSIDLRKRGVSSTDDGVFWIFDAGSDQPSNSLQDRLHKEGVIIASRKKGPDNAVQTAAMYNSHRQPYLLVSGLEKASGPCELQAAYLKASINGRKLHKYDLGLVSIPREANDSWRSPVSSDVDITLLEQHVVLGHDRWERAFDPSHIVIRDTINRIIHIRIQLSSFPDRMLAS